MTLLQLCFQDAHMCFPDTLVHSLRYQSKGPSLELIREHFLPDWSCSQDDIDLLRLSGWLVTEAEEAAAVSS